ncbi:MAG: oligosaccharide flippase family protein [Gammaproteobacteria bacterium]|nr:oligosaccharide flippase family protein [Gammaproteobacteria bacterium]
MLKKRALDYLQGDVLAKIMSFAAIMVIGGLASKEDIGIYNMMVFIAEMMAVFISFGADSAIVKFYREHTAGEVFNNYVFQNVLNICIAAVALYVTGVFLHEGVYQFISERYFAILFLAISLSISSITRAHMVSLHESVKVKWFSILSGALNLTSILLFASIIGLTVFSLVASRIVSLLLFVIFFAYLLVTLFDTKTIRLELTKKMYRFSVPLLISTLVGTLSVYMSRIVLAEYVTVYELGIFSFFIMVMASASVLLHSFNQAWFPHLFDLHKSAGEDAVLAEINKKLSNLLVLGFLYIALSIIAYQISTYISLALNGYYSYRYVFFVLMDSLVFGVFYIIINPLLYIKSQTKYVAYASFFTLVANVVMAMALVNLWGVFGAAVSAVAISFVTFLLYVKYSQKVLSSTLINSKNALLIVLTTSLLLIKYVYLYNTLN